MKNTVILGSVAGVVVIGAVVFALTRKKPASSASSTGFDPKLPPVPVTIATGYNTVDFKTEVLDLSHLLLGPDWRYHGSVVI